MSSPSLPFSGVRLPAVAGQFYPSVPDELKRSLVTSFENKSIGPGALPIDSEIPSDQKHTQTRADCYIVPHAGYMYSGPVAAHSYLQARASFQRKGANIAIILGPNHYGIGSAVALSPSKAWATPLGQIPVNTRVSKKISGLSGIIDTDEIAHSKEHSIEVQLPFLQYLFGGTREISLVPISLALQDKDTCADIASALFDALHSQEEKEEQFLVLGSSDLTHYETEDSAREKDSKLLASIEKMDVSNYYNVLERNSISACGYGAIAVVMEFAKKVGKSKGRLLKYATSGDTTGDKSSVVGYSAVHFE